MYLLLVPYSSPLLNTLVTSSLYPPYPSPRRTPSGPPRPSTPAKTKSSAKPHCNLYAPATPTSSSPRISQVAVSTCRMSVWWSIIRWQGRLRRMCIVLVSFFRFGLEFRFGLGLWLDFCFCFYLDSATSTSTCTSTFRLLAFDLHLHSTCVCVDGGDFHHPPLAGALHLDFHFPFTFLSTSLSIIAFVSFRFHPFIHWSGYPRFLALRSFHDSCPRPSVIAPPSLLHPCSSILSSIIGPRPLL